MTYAHKPLFFLCAVCGRPYDYTAEDRAQGGNLTTCPDCLNLRAELAHDEAEAEAAEHAPLTEGAPF